MSKLVWSRIAVIAMMVWLVFLVFLVLRGDHDNAITTVNAIWFICVISNVWLPAGRRGLAGRIAVFGALLAVWVGVHFWADPQEWSWHSGTVAVSLTMAGVALIYCFYWAWETAVSPQARKRWAAACITAISVAAALAVGFGVAFLMAHWRAAMANWGWLLVVFYLPALGFAWFVRHALTKRKREE